MATARVLPIDGTFNFRDLGGYPSHDGRHTRWRTLFRSDALHRLTPSGQQALVDMGLRTVIDLRTPAECASGPCVFAETTDVQYRSIPLFQDPRREANGSAPALSTIYRIIVDTRQVQLMQAIDALADADILPAVINCTAGKDRTGVVVALLLRLLGVEPGVIAEDYASSEALLANSGLREQVRARIAERGGDPDSADQLLVSPPKFMEQLLSYVDETYGGAEALAARSGLASERLARLREALLE